MIADGIKLIINPEQWWNSNSEHYHFSSLRLTTGLLIVATLPVVAVVLGHLGSFWLGYTEQNISIQRAAIGFLTLTAGAVAMGAAMALALFKITGNSKADAPQETIILSSLSIVAVAWLCGIVQIVSPLLDMNPEIGEILWLLLATALVFRIITRSTATGLGVTRRWRLRFLVQTMITFIILFIIFTIIPSLIMRYFMGVTGETFYGDPNLVQWPVPPPPNW